ncbi:MAG: OmpH family outer membrane protein [Holosporaceae bacterium]
MNAHTLWKKTRKRVCNCAVFLFAHLYLFENTPSLRADASQSQPPLTPTILVIDVMRVQQTAKIFQIIQEKIEKKASFYQKKMQTLNKKFETQYKELMQAKGTLDEPTFQTRYQLLQKNIATAQEMLKKKRAVLDASYQKAMRSVQKKINNFVQKALQQKRASIVLHKEATVATMNNVQDITNEAICFLNKELAHQKIRL